MFTGIIEETGRIVAMQKKNQSVILSVSAELVLENTKVGDSIAVNGVCLTVTSLRKDGFTADVMAETLRRSSLGTLSVGSSVNLERAMAADGRFGGHIVSGHIDGTGKIHSVMPEGNAVWIEIEVGDALLKYIVEKGSVAIDGISLTVAKLKEHTFSVSLIPHTAQETTLLQKKEGEIVNIENDVIGKYVERLLFFREKEEKKSSKITMDFLREHGF